MLENSEPILGPFKKITFLSVPPLAVVAAGVLAAWHRWRGSGSLVVAAVQQNKGGGGSVGSLMAPSAAA